MNREIFFRAKRIIGGEFVFGNLVQIYNVNGSHNSISIIQQDTGAELNVDCVSVGQFVGMSDKNNIKIFEGDIVRCNKENYVVYFDNEMLEFGLKCNNTLFHVQFNHEFDIIGNIHDNPELAPS